MIVEVELPDEAVEALAVAIVYVSTRGIESSFRVFPGQLSPREAVVLMRFALEAAEGVTRAPERPPS